MKLCIDLGATNVKGALVRNGTIVETASSPTLHFHGREGILSSLARTSDALFSEGVSEVCVSSAGDIDRETGICTYATGNLEDFTGFDFPAYYGERYGLPCHAANDGYCALLGELRFGAGRKFPTANIAMLTLGSGVGGAYAPGGVPDATKSSGAGKLGHLILHEDGLPCNCGKKGCIEQYLSGRAINRLANRFGLENDTLFSAFRAGDERAKKVFAVVAAELDAALRLIDAACPFDVCILGGGVVEGIGESFGALQANVSKQIVAAELGNRAGIFGAYCLTEDFS